MKKETWIDIIFWIWIIVGFVVGFNVSLAEEGANFGVLLAMIKENPSFLVSVIGFVIMMFFMQFIQNGIITIGYIAYKIVNRKHRKERIEKVDKKNDEYYREILPKYSVAVLSYVDDFEIGTNDVAATLLALKLKKCIEINEEGILVLDTSIDLADNEKYIIECIKNHSNISMSEFQKNIVNDAKCSELVSAQIEVKKKLISSLVTSVLSYITGIILIVALGMNSEILDRIETDFHSMMLLMYFLFMIACFAGFPTLIWVKFFMYMGVKAKDPYMRSKEGKEINKKLEGLRKYINDYSTMEDKDKESLTIWEEYLIYSVMFGINKKVAEDILRFVKVE